MSQLSTASSPARLESRGGTKRLATSKALFFIAAGLSFALSIWLWFSGDRERGLFVGLWVPSILAAGNLLLTGGRHD
ncbi:MAG TPA: hypothetical protein VLS88_09875 [Polyangiales bacterium]|jgi:hypothetical protein|nr:hypothetical protein [Polyangiales bacterium]